MDFTNRIKLNPISILKVWSWTRALEVGDVVDEQVGSVTDITTKKKMTVKSLVHFQSRATQRLKCK